MDPIQAIITALVAGASAALQTGAAEIVKDAYGHLKAYLNRHYQVGGAIDQLEKRPDSDARRGIVQEELTDAKAAQDQTLAQLAQKLLEALATQPPPIDHIKGVSLQEIKAAAIKLNDIAAQGAGNVIGVEIKGAEVGGAIEISGVRAGGSLPTAQLAATPPKIKILFLAANPLDTPLLRLDEEVRAIDQALRQAEYRSFDIRSHWAVRVDDLQELLLRHQPDIVHFSGHGSQRNEIILQDTAGNPAPVRASALRSLFRVLKDNIRCVVLNACYTAEQATAIAEVIDCVIGMSDAITDTASIQFSTAFYRALGYGQSVQTAFDLGGNLIDLSNLLEAHKPVLIADRIAPDAIRFVDPKA